ncbi:MAG: sugar porter family MFS transporter [Gammaproteobacteria bacterium]|nr:sugar porter family MFS transporter [Gammaproteobacteria bacterium]
MTSIFYSVRVALIVALGGFLMGFDASVISGVVKFIEVEFDLSKIELGWSVASLALSATFAMMLAGPISDRLGRKPVLTIAALLFLVSAVLSALAQSFIMLVVARMIGGLGVGAALIIAPMYIAEIAPSKRRGLMVSFNQLNIVVGISTAFFTNYLILKLGQSDASWALQLQFAEWNWRWMLGLEMLPALLYLLSLGFVPESPRWLIMQGRQDEALAIMTRACGATQARADLDAILDSLARQTDHSKVSIRELLKPSMRLVMVIGISVAVLQQITGINSVFFYAPMIFEQSGIGTDASFMQAILVGLVNLLFTLVALALIDKIGRKPLLSFGVSGIAICMFVLAFGFHSASYTLTPESIASLPAGIDRTELRAIESVTFNSDTSFRAALADTLGEEAVKPFESELVTAAISMNATLILAGILGFVACFAVSIGPVMWVLFSELFPNRVRGVAISFVGLINSGVSFTVQLIFPWELAYLGNAMTFLIYGLFALVGVGIIIKLLPETSGKSLEELERTLVNDRQPLSSQA